MKTAVVHARIEPETKEKAEHILRRLGISPTEAIRIFYNQICPGNGLPFPVVIPIPNQCTAATLEKSKLGEEIDEETDSLRFYFLGANWRQRVEHIGAKVAIDQEGPLIV